MGGFVWELFSTKLAKFVIESDINRIMGSVRDGGRAKGIAGRGGGNWLRLFPNGLKTYFITDNCN